MEDITNDILPTTWEQKGSIIKVIGIGGGGGNAVNHMYRTGIKDVDFVVCNTDSQALNSSPVPIKVRLGALLTKGRGAGCDPERGRQAAEESKDKLIELLSENTEMVFITAGMGGGTGTGAAPVIAKIAKEMGILTVGIVTLPFRHEGGKFIERARAGILEMQQHVDSLLVIDNQKLYDIYGNLSIVEAFPKADDVLTTAAKGIAEIITRPGYINVDFADVKMVMKDSGVAIMGTGVADGENRALCAVEEALTSPLLNDSNVSGAKNVLVNITSSSCNKSLTMEELGEIMQYIQERTGDIENCKRGVVFDDSIGDAISVTIVATGFGMHAIPEIHVGSKPEQKKIILYPSPENDPDDVVDDIDEYPAASTEFIIKDNVKVFDIRQDEQPAVAANPARRFGTPAGKPALIVEKDADISELERIPAYQRRKNAASRPNTATTPVPENAARVVTVNGTHRLNNNNSFLYQIQD